jgi:hypothetical protein
LGYTFIFQLFVSNALFIQTKNGTRATKKNGAGAPKKMAQGPLKKGGQKEPLGLLVGLKGT